MTSLGMPVQTDDPFDLVVGQDRAVEQLRAAAVDPVHAYLFVGPRGAGKRRAAAALAGELVGDPSDRSRARRLARTEGHPDLVIFEPEGTSYLMEEAEKIIVASSMASTEAGSKVIVLTRFEDASADVAAKLLKPIEEPPPNTRFVLLAERVAPEHVTISSRCTTIEFPAVSVDAIAAALEGRGVTPEVARAAAQGSGGDVQRAELLVTDEDFAARRQMWWDAPTRIDGTGFVATDIVAEIREAIDDAQAPLDARHLVEAQAMDEKEEMTGSRGSGRRAMETRHKREARLHRTDEWRMGLATLSQRYRESLLGSGTSLEVFSVLDDAALALSRNPSEELWITALFVRLPPLASS